MAEDNTKDNELIEFSDDIGPGEDAPKEDL